jgi:hypothetical protein
MLLPTEYHKIMVVRSCDPRILSVMPYFENIRLISERTTDSVELSNGRENSRMNGGVP